MQRRFPPYTQCRYLQYVTNNVVSLSIFDCGKFRSQTALFDIWEVGKESKEGREQVSLVVGVVTTVVLYSNTATTLHTHTGIVPHRQTATLLGGRSTITYPVATLAASILLLFLSLPWAYECGSYLCCFLKYKCRGVQIGAAS